MVPIVKKEEDRDAVRAAIEKLHAAAVAAGLRCKLDASTDKTPGWKFNHYEMKLSLSGNFHSCTVPTLCLVMEHHNLSQFVSRHALGNLLCLKE